MLPYTPLHHLLLRELGRPIVLTSGNVSDEPIAYDDEDALARLAGIADGFLSTTGRSTCAPTTPWSGGSAAGRCSSAGPGATCPSRSGCARRLPRPVLGCGAELKNTFCLGKDDHAFVSHHIGDLENYETFRSFTEGIAHFRRLFDVTPQVVAHDLHPEYLSTKYALDCEDVELVAVQHHHAHIASCLADNGEDGPGHRGGLRRHRLRDRRHDLGRRVPHRRPGRVLPGRVPRAGAAARAAAAIRQPWRMAAAYLAAAYPDGPPDGPRRYPAQRGRWDDVLAVARQRRQLAADLERGQAVRRGRGDPRRPGRDQLRGTGGGRARAASRPGRRAATRAASRKATSCRYSGRTSSARSPTIFAAGLRRPIVAARFHHGWRTRSRGPARSCASRTGLGVVALSGGVFQTCCCLTGPSSGSRPAASASWCTRRCRPTTAGSASARRPWPPPATGCYSVLVQHFQEFPGHYPHGYVTRLERGRRDGGRIDLDKGGKLGLGPDDLSPLAEPTPDSDHVRPTTRRGRFTRSPAHCSRGFLIPVRPCTSGR